MCFLFLREFIRELYVSMSPIGRVPLAMKDCFNSIWFLIAPLNFYLFIAIVSSTNSNH